MIFIPARRGRPVLPARGEGFPDRDGRIEFPAAFSRRTLFWPEWGSTTVCAKPLSPPEPDSDTCRPVLPTSTRLKTCGAKSNNASAVWHPAPARNCSWPPLTLLPPSPPPTVRVSFYTPNMPYDLCNCSNIRTVLIIGVFCRLFLQPIILGVSGDRDGELPLAADYLRSRGRNGCPCPSDQIRPRQKRVAGRRQRP
jgi:hypothetical protein